MGFAELRDICYWRPNGVTLPTSAELPQAVEVVPVPGPGKRSPAPWPGGPGPRARPEKLRRRCRRRTRRIQAEAKQALARGICLRTPARKAYSLMSNTRAHAAPWGATITGRPRSEASFRRSTAAAKSATLRRITAGGRSADHKGGVGGRLRNKVAGLLWSTSRG